MPIAPIELRIEGTDAGAQQALAQTERAVGRLNQEVRLSSSLFRATFSAEAIGSQIRILARDIGELASAVSGANKETGAFVEAQAQAVGALLAGNPFAALAAEARVLTQEVVALGVAYKELADAREKNSIRDTSGGGFQIDAGAAQVVNLTARLNAMARDDEQGAARRQAEAELTQEMKIQAKLIQDQMEMKRLTAGYAAAIREAAREEAAAAEKKLRDEAEMQRTIRNWEQANLRDYEDGQKDRQRAEQKRIEAGARAELKRQEDLESDASQRAAKAAALAQQFEAGAADAKEWAKLPPGEALRRRRAQAQSARREQAEERALEKRIQTAMEKEQRGAYLSSREKEALNFNRARNAARDAREAAADAKAEEAQAAKNIAAIKTQLETLSSAVTALLGI
jgi:hypothetical protein